MGPKQQSRPPLWAAGIRLPSMIDSLGVEVPRGGDRAMLV